MTDLLRAAYAVVMLFWLLLSGGVQAATILDDGFTQCAVEGGTCAPSPSGQYWMRFGSGASFVTYTQSSSSIPCRDTVETGTGSGFGGPYRTSGPRICAAKANDGGTVAPPGGLGFVRNGASTLYWPLCTASFVACTLSTGVTAPTNPGDVGVVVKGDAALLPALVVACGCVVSFALGVNGGKQR